MAAEIPQYISRRKNYPAHMRVSRQEWNDGARLPYFWPWLPWEVAHYTFRLDEPARLSTNNTVSYMTTYIRHPTPCGAEGQTSKGRGRRRPTPQKPARLHIMIIRGEEEEAERGAAGADTTPMQPMVSTQPSAQKWLGAQV